MSERIAKVVRSVDHAFDVEARTAQNEWDEYLDSRQYYQDEKGRVHDSRDGQKFAKDNVLSSESDDAYYDRLQAESEAEGTFAGKSLKEIAEMVSQARESNDKTLENDARAAFDDKFMEMAEKYNWQGTVENADGTITDRNVIADQKLAHYEFIMNGKADEAGVNAEPKAEDVASQPTPEDASSDTNNENEQPSDSNAESKPDSEPEHKSDSQPEPVETPFTENDQAELNKKLEEEDNYRGKHRAESQDENTPIYDEVAHEHTGGSADDAGVKEGESLEEFEARQPGKHRRLSADDLELLPVDGVDMPLSADDLEMLPVDEEESEVTAPQRSRLQRYGTPNRLYHETKAWASTRERGVSRRTRILAMLGGAAIAAGTAYFLIKGHDIRSGHGGGAGTGTTPPNPTHQPVIPGANVHHHVETVRVNPGDGEIKVTQHILADHGVRVNTTGAQQIGEHAGVHDILKGDDSYAHSGSTMDRIGDTGKFKVRAGVKAKLLKAAKQLGYK